MKKGRDLTAGPIGRGLFWFFVPLLLSNLLQQLYTTVDSVIVGQFLGKPGLAAIDAVSSLIRLPTNFFCRYVSWCYHTYIPVFWS